MHSPKSNRLLQLILVLTVALPRPADGEEQKAAESPSTGITFTSTVVAPHIQGRERDDTRAVPSAMVTVLKRGDAPVGAQTVGDLLKMAPGVVVRDAGMPGTVQLPSIRGSSPAQVEVFIDGIPSGRGGYAFSDMGRLPLATVDRVEIYRGTVPAHLGGGAVGGAVNIIRSPQHRLHRSNDGTLDPSRVHLTAGHGSFGTRHGSIQGETPVGRGQLEANAHYGESRGDFPFFNDNGTPRNREDDRITRRQNNHHRRGGGHLHYRRLLQGGQSEIRASGVLGAARSGLPGPGAVQASEASFSRVDTMAELGYRLRNLGGPGGTLDTRIWGTGSTDRFHDPAGEISLGRHHTSDRNWSGGGAGDMRLPLGRHHLLLTGVQIQQENHQPGGERASGAVDEAQRFRLAINAGDHISVADDRLLLPVFVRGEYYSSWGTAVGYPAEAPRAVSADGILLSPRIGAKLQLTPWLSLRGNWGLFHRLPSFMEMFGESGLVVGNPELKPERGENLDAGVLLQVWSRALLELSFFRSVTDDTIVLIQNTRSTGKSVNLGRTSAKGMETSTKVNLMRDLDIQASYTLLDSKNLSPIPSQQGKRLPGRPLHQLNLLGRYRMGPMVVQYDLDATGRLYLDPANFKPVPSRILHGAGLEALLWRGGPTLHLSVRNLLDTKVRRVPLLPRLPGDPDTVPQPVADFIGYPLPGRNFMATLSWGLNTGEASP